MAKYKFSNKAVYDLTQIWNYTVDKWSENQADRYYHMLIENLLGFKAGRHIIFYRMIEKNEVEIIRILHEQMDLKNKITEK